MLDDPIQCITNNQWRFLPESITTTAWSIIPGLVFLSIFVPLPNGQTSWLIHGGYYTLPETNIAPENRPLEKEIPIGNHHFLGANMLVVGRVTTSVGGRTGSPYILQVIPWQVQYLHDTRCTGTTSWGIGRLPRSHHHLSGQIISTSHGSLTPNCSVLEGKWDPLCQGTLGEIW